MQFLNGSSQLGRTPKTAFAAALDIGIAALIALVLLRAMFFFELTLTPTITVLLTHAIPMETSTGIAVINASVFTRLVDVILSLITAICFMYLAQLYKRPYGITIALVLAVCDWAWYFWEVGGIQGMLNSEYGLLREVLVFMEAPIALWMSWYLRRITIGWSDRGSRLR